MGFSVSIRHVQLHLLWVYRKLVKTCWAPSNLNPGGCATASATISRGIRDSAGLHALQLWMRQSSRSTPNPWCSASHPSLRPEKSDPSAIPRPCSVVSTRDLRGSFCCVEVDLGVGEQTLERADSDARSNSGRGGRGARKLAWK